MNPEFDQYAEQYSRRIEDALPFFAKEHDVFIQIKAEIVRRMAALVQRDGVVHVLDLGCGVGRLEHFLREGQLRMVGMDVSPKELDKARIDNPHCTFEVFDGQTIPSHDSRFDLVFAINVFHHVPLGNRQRLLEEMTRVTRSGGLVALFEHNPFNPLTRRVVARCEFDRDAILLKPREVVNRMAQTHLRDIQTDYFLFLPVYHKVTTWIDQCLRWLPLGAQFCTFGRKMGREAVESDTRP